MPRAFVRAAVAGTALILASILGGGAASGIEVSGRLDLESRWYYQDGDHPGQESQATGFVLEPKLYAEDDERRSVTLTPFFRYDGTDPRRTHFDVREAYLLVLGENLSYESAAEEWHVDLAARYSHSFGPLDLGLSVFDGTSREPCLVCVLPRLSERGELLLVPHYEQIRQLGLDAQLTIESWLFKLEAIHRAGASNQTGREEDYAALVAGVEYTINSVFGSEADLGLLAEWNYDGRRENATNVFDNDIFVGARLAFNDVQSTDLTASMLADADHSTRSMVFEFNRRLSDRWSLHLEAVAILAVDRADLTHYQTRRDSFIELQVTYNF